MKKTPLLKSDILADRLGPLLLGAAQCATLASLGVYAYGHAWRFLAFAAVCLAVWFLWMWRLERPAPVRPDPPPRRPLARLVAAEQAVRARHLRQDVNSRAASSAHSSTSSTSASASAVAPCAYVADPIGGYEWR